MAEILNVTASCGHAVQIVKGTMRAAIDDIERRGICPDCRSLKRELDAANVDVEERLDSNIRYAARVIVTLLFSALVVDVVFFGYTTGWVLDFMEWAERATAGRAGA